MTELYWRIRGYEGLRALFDERVPIGCLTEGQLKDLLKCLAAKLGLTHDEIIGAYVKRKTKRANDLLHVERQRPYPEYSCGNNPHVTASVVDDKGERTQYPRLS